MHAHGGCYWLFVRTTYANHLWKLTSLVDLYGWRSYSLWRLLIYLLMRRTWLLTRGHLTNKIYEIKTWNTPTTVTLWIKEERSKLVIMEIRSKPFIIFIHFYKFFPIWRFTSQASSAYLAYKWIFKVSSMFWRF